MSCKAEKAFNLPTFVNSISFPKLIQFTIFTDWKEKVKLPFPNGGILKIFTKFPSSNSSMKSTNFDRHVMVAFSLQPHPKLKLKGELATIYSWYCYSPGKRDVSL